MTANLRQSARFAAYFVIAFLLLQYTLESAGAFVIRHAPTRFAAAHSGQIDVDVLVVGNSRGERVMTPQTQDSGLSVFNLSWGGLRRPAAIALVKDFFESGNVADIVLVEASSLILSDRGQCDLKSFWAILPNLKQSSLEVCARDLRLASLFPLSKYNAQPARQALFYMLFDPDGDSGRDTLYPQTIEPSQCDNIWHGGFDLFYSAFAEVADGDVSRGIAELQSYLSANAPNTTLILTLAPFVSSPSTRARVDEIRRRAADLFGDWNYIDLHEDTPAGCAYFADAVHLNTNGIRRLRPVLEQYIKSN